MPFGRSPFILLAALWLAPAAASADEPAPVHEPAHAAGEDLLEYVEGASRLEGRIIAPCCWNQTIDIHGSEPAYELRREIRRRLKAGESADAIEASLVQRFGPKILAVQDSSPVVSVAHLLGLGFVGAGIGAYFMLKRWTRAGTEPRPKSKKKSAAADGEPQRDALDDRLDRELAEIGDEA